MMRLPGLVDFPDTVAKRHAQSVGSASVLPHTYLWPILRMQAFGQDDSRDAAATPRVRLVGCRLRFSPTHTSGLLDKLRNILLQREWWASNSICGQLPECPGCVSPRTFADPIGGSYRRQCDNASRRAGSRRSLGISGRYRAGPCGKLRWLSWTRTQHGWVRIQVR
jgi:hypothetical protein